jgi:predicted phage-related endonuclease
MNTIPKQPHGSLAWLQDRHQDEQGRVRFGASEAPILMGVSDYKTITDLAIEKWSPPAVKEQTPAMMRGHLLEPALLEYAAQVLGAPVTQPDVMFINGRMIATLDGVAFPDDDYVIVEAKTTTRYSSDEALPAMFYWQGVAQLACEPAANRVLFVCLDRWQTLGHWTITREQVQADIDILMFTADEVGSYLDRRELPPHAPITETHVKVLYPSPHGTKEIGWDGVCAVNRFTAAKQAADDAEAELQAARDSLTAMLAEADTGTVDGHIIVTYKSRSTGSRLDTKALEQEHPELVAKYKKQAGTTRVLKVI